MGETIQVFVKPSQFSGNGTMTWTVAVANVTLYYCLIGMRMFVDYLVDASTIGGALNTRLQIQIPDGWFAARAAFNPCRITDNGVLASGLALVSPGGVGLGNQIQILRMDGVNWTATPIVQGQINFEVRTA